MNKRILNIILTTISGLLVSLIIGFFFFRGNVFNFNHPAALFLFYGFYGSLFYSLHVYGNRVSLFASLPAVIAFQFIIMGKFAPDSFYIRDLVLLISLFLSVFLYFQISNKLYDQTKTLVSRVLTLSVLYSIINGIFGLILFVIQTQSFQVDVSLMIFYAQYAFLIGFGFSLGSMVYNYYLERPY